MRVAEYWIVDPEARLIERWRPVSGVPPLVVDVAALFAELPEPRETDGRCGRG